MLNIAMLLGHHAVQQLSCFVVRYDLQKVSGNSCQGARAAHSNDVMKL